MIIWISSYPKSGNTWVRAFISTYYYSEDDNFDFRLLKNIKQFPHEKFFKTKISNINEAIDNWDKGQIDINNKNKFIFLKTHSALVRINNKPFTNNKHTIGGIYIVRDPRNVITSISNHYQLNFNESLEFMMNKKKYLLNINDISNYANFTFLHSWSEHYRSWKINKQFNLLFIKYEDLEKNPFETFKKVIIFINKILNKNEIIDELRLKKIINSISFDRLKEKEKSDGFPEAILNKQNKKVNFFYMGKKNNWKNILTDEQKNILNKVFEDDLKILNY